jgi:hypothetical protein
MVISPLAPPGKAKKMKASADRGEKDLIWLPEPPTVDATPAVRGEHTLDWLARSTNPKAVACRRFLNDNFRALREDHRSNFQQALRVRWRTGIFELIVARTLQVMGATIDIETATESGRSPDFRATFEDGVIIVEATAPVIDGAVGNVMKARSPLIEYIESVAPGGWVANVLSLPSIGPSASQKEFKRAVKEMLASFSPRGDAEPQHLSRDLPSGTIEMWLHPKPDARGVGIEPPISVIGNTEPRIRRAIDRKRSQVRGADVPVVLAINASGITSSPEDFDHALFGRSTLVLDEHRQVAGTKFLADGEFAKARAGAPTYAAVLAFDNVELWGIPDPILYRHPRFFGRLPQTLRDLEQRSLDAKGTGIEVSPSRKPGMLGFFGTGARKYLR